MKMLLAAAGALAAGMFAGHYQLPSAPPMKLGLWETTTTTTMLMPDMPQMSGRPPQVIKVRTCVTAESWAKAFGGAQRQQDCSHIAQHFSGGHYTFDVSCPASSTTGHGDIDFSSPNEGHGKIHIESNPSGHHFVADTMLDSHFVGADCGSVTPGQAQILH